MTTCRPVALAIRTSADWNAADAVERAVDERPTARGPQACRLLDREGLVVEHEVVAIAGPAPGDPAEDVEGDSAVREVAIARVGRLPERDGSLVDEQVLMRHRHAEIVGIDVPEHRPDGRAQRPLLLPQVS